VFLFTSRVTPPIVISSDTEKIVAQENDIKSRLQAIHPGLTSLSGWWFGALENDGKLGDYHG